MPQMRKLATEEVQLIENKGKGQRKLVEEQYDGLLNDYAVGDYGEATLDSDEKRLTVRNRLRAAAIRRQLDLAFKRTSGDHIRFQIIEPVVAAPPEPTPPKHRGGRPKKKA